MKNRIYRSLFITVITAFTLSASAQQVNTLYFLDNAPVRHYINPAFNPISNFYLSLPVIGYTSLQAGNNSLTMSKVLWQQDGQYKTYLHPDADKNKFVNSLRRTTLINMEAQTSILSFGFRLKEKNYLHLTIDEKVEGDVSLPRDMFSMALLGFMPADENGYYKGNYNLKRIGSNISLYTSIGLGYTREINEKWAVGGKLNFLLGQAHVGNKFSKFNLDLSEDRWNVDMKGDMAISAVSSNLFIKQYPELTQDGINDLIDNTDNYFNTSLDFSGYSVNDYIKMLKPAGYGASLDLGFTYKPIQQLQISAAVTDFGFIRWKGQKYKFGIDNITYDASTIDINFGDYYDAETSTIDGQGLMDTVVNTLTNLALNGISNQTQSDSFWKMTTATLNVGVDANFWDNRVGVGVYSKTRFFNGNVYEEVTLGAAFRPVHWFNLAASYSFVNGQWGTLGLALGLVTYEGLGLFLAADYIPTSYASISSEGGKFNDVIPYKASTLNLAFGLNIVIGHRKDKDHDGVYDKYDLCPDTPRKVKVDSVGCPLDEDGDGVPDYLDECPGTPSAAKGFVDEKGCLLDTDGDGVPDYLDQCPDSPEAARGYVDSVGCPLDTDGDGVPDYMDECPDTPAAAWGYVDSVGCPLDTDGDGVPDYLDECSDTPAEAKGFVDNHGCPLDSDLDGVPDYLDECPETPRQAYGFVDEKGCLLDTDGDGVPDYIDRCNDTPAGDIVDEWGCSKDSDGDGVPDYKDECPNTPKAARGFVDEKGCPIDTDGDGVPDYLDQCPTVPGSKDNHGCPAVKKEVRNLLKKAMQGIQFETGSATIKKTSHPLLNQIANIFIDNKDYKVEIQGHTDNVGKPEFNQDLSEKRAQAVRKYLIDAGVPESQLTAHGYGDTMPIESNKTAAGRAKNRRVEFVISFEEVSYEEVNDRVQPNDTTAKVTPQEGAAQAE